MVLFRMNSSPFSLGRRGEPPAPDLRTKLRAVWQRELRGNGYRARWVSVQTAAGPVPAVTFVINRDHERRQLASGVS